jgi:hypothetical protein
MSDVRHACVYCCHGNAAKRFPTLRDNDYKTICVCYTIGMIILLRDSWPHDLQETY